MSRSEVIDEAYPNAVDVTPFFEQEYLQLLELWKAFPDDERDSALDLPKPLNASANLPPEILKRYSSDALDNPISSQDDIDFLNHLKAVSSAKANNVRTVDQRYRHRMAIPFAASLPDIFRRVMMMADDPYALDLLFFGTITTLSACLPGVKGSYDRETILPNLFLFVTGNAAAGKGRISLCRKLLDPIHNRFSSRGQFIIPANSSDTAIYEQLAENDGFGIIFETEADTLSDALGKASGRFSEGLRKAFHNETISYMRRTNNERVVIPHPYLSILLTGTPRQLGRLVKDPENGLFSRFLFYRLQSQQESFPERQPLHNGITGQMVDDYMHYLGDMILDFFLRLRDKQADSDNDTSICFALTEDQETAFQRHFNKAAKDYSALFLRLYDSEDRAADAESIMRRLGNICFRMMMILTVSRLITEDVQPIPDTIFCDQRDFDSVLAMEPQLRLHNNLHFDEMLVANGSLPPLDSEYPANGDMLFLDERDFFNQLPSEFIKQEANQLGLKMSLSNATIKRYLAHLCDLGLVERLRRGSYRKTGKGNVLPSQP